MLPTNVDVRGFKILVSPVGSSLVLVLTWIHNLDLELLVIIRAGGAGGQCCAE